MIWSILLPYRQNMDSVSEGREARKGEAMSKNDAEIYQECLCTIAWAYIDHIQSTNILWDMADFLNRAQERSTGRLGVDEIPGRQGTKPCNTRRHSIMKPGV